ncbi:hypothetical protein N1851_000181 [Merluccius polli]|uniref:Uncharacterized protein n=1 Tax=Merluccius polli TaxID=89951 RepID=A0AA47NEC3_MERPO|nr:hypothetical protein N1851_000181 [Merluccius polli]
MCDLAQPTSSGCDFFRTNMLENGHLSLLTPCPNHLQVKEKFSTKAQHCTSYSVAHDTLGNTIFERTKEDDKVGLSIEDRLFLELMDKDIFMDDTNSWVDPLPFRSPQRQLPNNPRTGSQSPYLSSTHPRKPTLQLTL